MNCLGGVKPETLIFICFPQGVTLGVGGKL